MTLAIPFRDAKKRPPPLPVTTEANAAVREQIADAASSAPPPLPSMRVPKGIIVHDAQGDEIDVHAAVLKARRATEELEWQAQVKRAKESLADGELRAPARDAQNDEAAEWDALRTRMKSVQLESTPRAPQTKKPARKLAVVPPPAAATSSAQRVEPAAPLAKRIELVPAPGTAADEEREWQELRARARVAEEREWEELIARARTTSLAPAHPFDAPQMQRPRPPRAQPRIVAWP